MISINVFWQRPQSYYDQAKWRGTKEFDGGALMNQASHYVDLLVWLFGPIKSINAFCATLGREIEVEDSAVLNLRWNNGAVGTMSVSMLSYPKNLEGSITVIGEKGNVKVGGTALNHFERWEFSNKDENNDELENINYEIKNVYGNGHVPYYANVADVFRGISKPSCDGREGLKSLEIIIGAYQSSASNKTINLPL